MCVKSLTFLILLKIPIFKKKEEFIIWKIVEFDFNLRKYSNKLNKFYFASYNFNNIILI